MSKVVCHRGLKHDLDDIVKLMDDKLMSVLRNMAHESDQEFFDQYCRYHRSLKKQDFPPLFYETRS